jgi:hypothetical protein
MYNKTVQKTIMKWREAHKEEYNEYMRNKILERYNQNKELINNRRKELYHKKKDIFYLECQIFRKILI